MNTTEVLYQKEIDQLLTAISSDGSSDLTINYDPELAIKRFEDQLLKRKINWETPYGIFDEDISVCRYFDDGKNEGILSDIKKKNDEQGMGNIKVPNTNITLLNYSICDKCKTIYSFKEITEYYMNPKPDQRFLNRSIQFREDTRVCCSNCGKYFLPSLVISDGTPRNEVQFLCRTQTINAVEKHLFKKNILVLTMNKSNIIQKGNLKAIKNDVYIKDLCEKPTLISNMIQYTPFKYIMNLIDGSNVQKGDLLFDQRGIKNV